MCKSKPEVKFVDINLPKNKARLLKSREALHNLQEEDQDIYADGTLERYYQRPI